MTRRRLALAEKLRITSPCDASWQTMQEGDDTHRRFCTSCDRHVHDASKLTRREVEKLLVRAGGERICFHLHVRRSDGAILLADGHAVPPRGALRASLAVMAAAGALAACTSPQHAPTAVPHGSVEIPHQPPAPPATVVTPAPVEPPIAIASPEPLIVEEPIPPLPPAEPPPKPAKASKPVKPATPVKQSPAHPSHAPKKPPIYDQIDGGVW